MIITHYKKKYLKDNVPESQNKDFSDDSDKLKNLHQRSQ